MQQTLAYEAEVQTRLQADDYETLLDKMYGNTPSTWSKKMRGYARLRFIINCLTRMRMLTAKGRLNFSRSGSPFHGSGKLVPWFDFEDPATAGTRVIFGHWSALGLTVLPKLVSLDSGCVWGRQLTAVRLDKKKPRVIQVAGQSA